MASQQQVKHYSAMAVQAAAVAAHGIPGYEPAHGEDGGEMAALLGDVPCLVRYELTSIGVEVTEVSVRGSAPIPAGYFDAATVQGWELDVERSRSDEGWVL